jgi:hypothetical protein
VIETLTMRSWISILVLTTCAIAQSDRPALTTRKEFANSNLLISLEDVIGTTEVTRRCIRIQPDGRFHREKGSLESKAKFGEAGQLSSTELAQLKAMLDDPEFKSYRQDPNAFLKTDRPSLGYRLGHEIFKLSIARDGVHHQDLFFDNEPNASAAPAKIQALQHFLRDLERRKDPTLKRVPADGCRPHVNRPSSK